MYTSTAQSITPKPMVSDIHFLFLELDLTSRSIFPSALLGTSDRTPQHPVVPD